MNDRPVGRVHWNFWMIGVLALIWNLMGGMNFIGQMNSGTRASMPEVHRAIIEGRPAWATGAFAIAVFGGTLGCVLLLLRKLSALYLFIASLLGVIVQTIPYIGLTRQRVNYGMPEICLIILLPLAIAVFQVWYSRLATNKGWIR